MKPCLKVVFKIHADVIIYETPVFFSVGKFALEGCVSVKGKINVSGRKGSFNLSHT